jgi:heme A synthase
VADAGRRQPGWYEALAVGAVAVAVVLGAAIGTSLLPPDIQAIVFRTPLLIVILVVVTGGLLWRLVGRRPPTA